MLVEQLSQVSIHGRRHSWFPTNLFLFLSKSTAGRPSPIAFADRWDDNRTPTPETVCNSGTQAPKIAATTPRFQGFGYLQGHKTGGGWVLERLCGAKHLSFRYGSKKMRSEPMFSLWDVGSYAFNYRTFLDTHNDEVRLTSSQAAESKCLISILLKHPLTTHSLLRARNRKRILHFSCYPGF